jgi:hypothetical protein
MWLFFAIYEEKVLDAIIEISPLGSDYGKLEA